MTATVVGGIFIPAVWNAYLEAETMVRSKLVESGAVVLNSELSAKLAGGGLTFDAPGFDDLPDDAENIPISTTGSPISANDVVAHKEVMVRLSRNQMWGSMDLARVLAGADPMGVVSRKFAGYWKRRLQAAVRATLVGVFADNDANDSGDYTHDITDTYEAGVTDFSAEAFIDACQTMGDAEEDLGIVVMHSVVYAKAKKNNLIDMVQDSMNPGAQKIPTFLGRMVIVDDNATEVSSQDYDTLILGAGAIQLGMGAPAVPLEHYREPLAGAGGGVDNLISRVEWIIHPVGHAYIGTAAAGGPSNATSANNLGAAGSWNRVYAERKQVKIARLRTTEA